MIRRVLSSRRHDKESKFGRGYEPLLPSESHESLPVADNSSSFNYNQEEDNIRRKMQNQLGFCNGSSFRIINVGDGSSMEVVGNKVMTRPRSEDPDKTNFQLFNCTTTASGHFEISSHYQKPGQVAKMVWDFLPHRGTLIQKRQTKSARGNQNWASETVPGKEATYFLLKAPEGTHCLQNMGVEKQIMVVEKNATAIASAMTQWKLESIQPRL